MTWKPGDYGLCLRSNSLSDGYVKGRIYKYETNKYSYISSSGSIFSSKDLFGRDNGFSSKNFEKIELSELEKLIYEGAIVE